jgi:DNA-directed RNA polymerase subunit RPC12/RpoP
MKCSKCGKQFLFYVSGAEIKCPKCKSIIICDEYKTSLKLLCLYFLITFPVGLFFGKENALVLIIILIIISIPFLYKIMSMECRVIREGDRQEKSDQVN